MNTIEYPLVMCAHGHGIVKCSLFRFEIWPLIPSPCAMFFATSRKGFRFPKAVLEFVFPITANLSSCHFLQRGDIER